MDNLEIWQDGYWSRRWLVITPNNGDIIKGFDILDEAKKAYPNALISDELYDDPG